MGYWKFLLLVRVVCLMVLLFDFVEDCLVYLFYVEVGDGVASIVTGKQIGRAHV